jgi:bifunctional non-homologous end joining protein LigD
MPLDTYRRKRDFARTPEPRGARARQSKALTFVVQKHAARRLHYDFRLELDGVLKSWAVPKQPSPRQKRLAVHVEDHPLDYATFQGMIPAGEYGAGKVEIWDEGTWTPEGDPRKGYAEGKLSFALKGRRLSGRWALVRMGRRAKEARGDNWLLLAPASSAGKTRP